MPVVFVTDAPTASGHRYDDVLGKQYEFPARYDELVTPGDAFIYYRGSRGSSDGRASYFGVGVVGQVRASSRADHLIAQVHDVQLFDSPVFAKAADGTYLETDSTRGTNWPNGVRRISMDVLERVLDRATGQPNSERPTLGRANAIASPQHASAMERYSVAVAMDLLAELFGADHVREMPPGNPGFDILVDRVDGDLHVEVKGTVLPDPVFHLSEGQRQHAAARGRNFWLIVVYSINVTKATHEAVRLEGPLDRKGVELQPEAWTGRVVHASSAV